MRGPFIALAIAATTVLAASCSAEPPNLDTKIPSNGPPAIGEGDKQDKQSATMKVRVVNVMSPGLGPLDIVQGGQFAADRKILHADVTKPGTVTDYLSVPVGAVVSMRESKRPITDVHIGAPPKDKPNARATVIVNDTSPKTFWEADGKQGRAAEGAGVKWITPPAGKAVVALLPEAGGSPSRAGTESFEMSEPGKGCVPVPPEYKSESGGTLVIDVYMFYPFDAGDHELLLSNWVDCRAPSTKKMTLSVKAGQSVFVLPWFATKSDLRMMIVPISVDGPGNAGVAVSEGGVEFAPRERQSPDQNSPPTTFPESPTEAPTTESSPPSN